MYSVVFSYYARAQAHATHEHLHTFLRHNYRTHAQALCALIYVNNNFRMGFVILLLLQILMNVEIARQMNAN